MAFAKYEEKFAFTAEGEALVYISWRYPQTGAVECINGGNNNENSRSFSI